MYYPSHLKYKVIGAGGTPVKTNSKTSHWRLSVVLAGVVALHMFVLTLRLSSCSSLIICSLHVVHRLVCTFVTFGLLLTTNVNLPASPAQDPRIAGWAKFLGLTSAALAAIQYCPQLWHTFRLKLVGALSIPMMIIQSPGAALMVLSIAMRWVDPRAFFDDGDDVMMLIGVC